MFATYLIISSFTDLPKEVNQKTFCVSRINIAIIEIEIPDEGADYARIYETRADGAGRIKRTPAL